jgi:macrolide transport system ATP-binding/permease protein
MGLFRELWEQGRTVVVITHDPALARRASRQVEIRDGRLTADSGGAGPA